MRIIIPGILFLFLATITHAQNSALQAGSKADEYFSQPKNEYSISLSYLLPSGTFGNQFIDEGGFNLQEMLTNAIQNTGMGAKKGYELDMSECFYFNKQPLQTIGGMKLSLTVGAIPFRWYKPGQYIFNDADYSGFRFLSFKIGPVMRTATGKTSAVRFYDQLVVAISWNAGWFNNAYYYSFYDSLLNRYDVTDQSEFKMHTGAGIKNEIGFSFNINRLMAAIGFSFGKIKFNDAHFNRNGVIEIYRRGLNGSYNYNGSERFDADLPLTPSMPENYFFFSLGYNVGSK